LFGREELSLPKKKKVKAPGEKKPHPRRAGKGGQRLSSHHRKEMRLLKKVWLDEGAKPVGRQGERVFRSGSGTQKETRNGHTKRNFPVGKLLWGGRGKGANDGAQRG